MSNFSSERAMFNNLRLITAYILICFFRFSQLLSSLSNANAQTREQIEMARQLGVDIEDFSKGIKQEDTGIGQQYEDFMLDQEKQEDKKSLSTYLGFSEFEERFGSEIFSNQRKI